MLGLDAAGKTSELSGPSARAVKLTRSDLVQAQVESVGDYHPDGWVQCRDSHL